MAGARRGELRVPFPGTTTLNVVLKDVNGVVLTGRTITFLSSNTGVATVGPTGIVTGVDYDNGAPELAIGKTRVPLTNITSISQ